jgi:hypothetical protein
MTFLYSLSPSIFCLLFGKKSDAAIIIGSIKPVLMVGPDNRPMIYYTAPAAQQHTMARGKRWIYTIFCWQFFLPFLLCWMLFVVGWPSA